jgi:hypothetical protein
MHHSRWFAMKRFFEANARPGDALREVAPDMRCA